MSMTYDDYAREMALDELHQEAVMERATREQCIYLFVEGESERIAFPILLGNIVNLEELGVVVAVYNGNGNLYTALKLLSQTLSYDRPVIATYDNDPDGVRSVRRYRESDFVSDRVFFHSIPTSPVVEFPHGHRGGSFEESFAATDFLAACFSPPVLPHEISERRQQFESLFEPGKPWLDQVRKFCAQHGFKDWSARKPILAERLAEDCAATPDTYEKLANLIRDVRQQHPVRHPDDVELPKVQGLTYWPDKENGQSAGTPSAGKP